MKQKQKLKSDVQGLAALAFDTLRIEMIRRRLSKEQLAAKCGIEAASFGNEFSRGITSIHLQRKIEAALGLLPIWSPALDCHLRQRSLECLGFDFGTCGLSKLRSTCTRLGLDVRSPKTRRSLENAVRAHLAVLPKSHTTTTNQHEPK